MAPVTALWLFAVPLIDTVATMLRRILKRRSPFSADRTHLHHLLLDAGFTVPQTVFVMAGLQLVMGVIGLVGANAGVAEHLMFAGVLTLFAVYVLAIGRRSRFVALAGRLHRLLGLPANGVDQVYIGGLPRDCAQLVLGNILGKYSDAYGSKLYAYEPDGGGGEYLYAIVGIGCEFQTKQVIPVLRRRAQSVEGVVVRQVLPRRRSHATAEARGQQWQRTERRTGRSRLVESVDRAAADEPRTVQGHPAAVGSRSLRYGTRSSARLGLRRR